MKLNSMPEVPGQILIDGIEHSVCMKPVIRSSNEWSISNFDRNYQEDRIYSDIGPHIKINLRSEELLRKISFNDTIEFSSGLIPTVYGSVSMLQGRPVCEFPTETRLFEKINLLVTRTNGASKFEFHAVAGKCLDCINKPIQQNIYFWFEVNDSLLKLFIPNNEERDIFENTIKSCNCS